MSLHPASERFGQGQDQTAPGPPLMQIAGVRLGLVLCGGLAVVDVWRLTDTPSYAVLVALAFLAMLSSVGMSTGTALGCAGIAWLVVDGFVVHRAAVLAWDGPADLGRLGLLVGLTTLATRGRR